MVRKERLELSHLAAPEPKSGASTNFATSANLIVHLTSGKEEMARPGGFEPPTAWFVARYSIQLSYGRVVGWGTWIRTREWRHQKPLPYRLAIPQQRRV